MTLKGLGTLISLFALTALVATGCGGGDGSTTASESTASESTATSTEESLELTGEPYIIGGLTPVSGEGYNYPDWNAGAVAVVEAINAEGGIDGRPVEYWNCNDQNNPNEAGKCAREMVSKGVIGIAGGATLFSESVSPILTEANIPWVGMYAAAPEEFNNENMFPLDPSAYGQGPGSALALKEGGAKAVGLEADDLPVAKEPVELFEAALEPLGLTHKGTSRWPLTQVDFSPQVQQMINNGPEGVGFIGLQLQFVNYMKTANQLGAGFKFSYSDGGLTPENFKTVGNYEVYVFGGLPPVTAGEKYPGKFPGVEEFRENMDTAAENGEQYADEKYLGYQQLRTWLAVKVIAQIANEMSGEITAPKVTETLNAAKDIETGVIPPWTPGGSKGPENYTRLSNPYLYVSEINDEGQPELLNPEPVNIVELVSG